MLFKLKESLSPTPSPRLNISGSVAQSMKAKQMGKRHTSSILTDHIVFTPKFRARMLVGSVAKDCERLVKRTCYVMDVEVLQLAVAADHVHLFVQYPPELSLSTVVERIKSNTSRELRLRYPHLVKWNKDGFWASGCYHGSVGQGFDVVERYILGQRQFRSYRSS